MVCSCADQGEAGEFLMDIDKINAAVVQCLEHAAESSLPPASAASDFLRLLLADGSFTSDEVNAATLKVSRIIRGIGGRQPNEHAL
jgi:hypothetical protein